MENTSICFTDIGKVEFLDKPIPIPKIGELLIKSLITQVSIGTEMSILMKNNIDKDSVWDIYGKFPFDAGYINIGTVIDVGEGIDKSWIGMAVASYGTHSKYIVAPATECHPLPEGIDPKEAIYFVLSEIAMNGIRKSNISWGDIVTVYGAGNIGQLTARYCQMAGAQLVFVVDQKNERLELLPNNPTIIPINNQMHNVEEFILSKTNGIRPDIIFEITGVANVIPEEAALLKNCGKLIILSSPRGKTNFDFHDLCNAKSLNIIGAHNSSHPVMEEQDNRWTKKRHAQLFFQLLQQGKLNLSNINTHIVPYTEAISIYENLKDSNFNAEGILFEWN